MNMKIILWALIIFALLIVVAPASVLFIIFSMMPGLVAYIIDRTEEKSATFCVGGLNFCGAFPYLLELWLGDHSVGQAMQLLTDVFVLAVMYGGAAMGWMLYLSLPPVIASFIQVMSQKRLDQLRSTQRELLEEWGDELITDADLGGEFMTPTSEGEHEGVPAPA